MLKILLLLSLLLPVGANAALDIEIIGGAAQQIPIAVLPFNHPLKRDDLSQVISADLYRSGLFRLIETGGVATLPRELAEVKYPEWTALQAQGLVIGKVEPSAGGRLKVSFRLLDVLKQNQMAAFEYDITPGQLRQTAHKIADVIYQKFTGEPGVFATRISYVLKNGPRYTLVVADADGYGPQPVLSSTEPIISPTWAPDGTKLAYVSFEKKKPIIYVQSLTSGQRTVLANYKGNNSAPAWSPDSQRLAIVLTQGANSQISIINADGTGLQKLSRSQTIDTEPQWSPDGKWIYFSSDRGGSPQIYRMSPLGGEPQRVTFDGSYNVSPRLSPDGKQLAFIRRDGGKFQIAMQDLANHQVQVLSDSANDESPSFAPNGRLIIYATKVNGKGVLSVVSSDGKVRQRLSEGGDVREPAWGPAVN
ncbi:MAG: Tol-Pal system beta propeller repeat protein TolB [Methylophilales bacterium]|nr:Tol-Pal system beta propeller repeat protein TolB [Methylophilales bacterium]